MEVKFTKLNKDAITPTKGDTGAAGFDMYSCDDVTIEQGQIVKVHTGIAMEIPDGYFGGLYPRSGLASKEGIRLANTVGVVDSTYRGEVLFALIRDIDFVEQVHMDEFFIVSGFDINVI